MRSFMKNGEFISIIYSAKRFKLYGSISIVNPVFVCIVF